MLDYGCGSGILSILAFRLGASAVVGCDLKPTAVNVARRNTAANMPSNEVSGTVDYFLPPLTALYIDPAFVAHSKEDPTEMTSLPDDATAFDVVLCNIVAGPLALLAPTLAQRCRRSTLIALAGE